MSKSSAAKPPMHCSVRTERLKAERLAVGNVISAADLTTATWADRLGEARSRIETSGLCHGLLGWTRIRLGDEWLSTDPDSPEVHWSPALLPLDPPLPLDAGEEIGIGLQRPAQGEWTWSIKAASGSRRHSSFLARADGLRRLRKAAADACPGLGRHGENTLRVLAMMQARRSNLEIAQSLADSDHQAFQDFESSLQHVQALAMRFGGNG